MLTSSSGPRHFKRTICRKVGPTARGIATHIVCAHMALTLVAMAPRLPRRVGAPQPAGFAQAKTQSGIASGTRSSLTLLYRSLANLSRMAAVLLCRASRRAWYSSRAAGASWPGV